MLIRLGTTIAAFAVLSACARDSVDTPLEPVTELDVPAPEIAEDAQPAAEKIPAIAEVAESEGPISITIDTEHITAAATIDEEIVSFAPALAARIKSELETALVKAKDAAEEEAEFDFFMPHDYQYDYKKSARVGNVISVEYFNMFFTGGAHPNYLIGGIIHDRSKGQDIVPKNLLSESGEAAMKALLMEELAKMKQTRMSMEPEDLPMLRGEVAEVFPVETDFWFGEVTLVPSTEAEKFGGLVVHYSPYDVGAYAEGSYEILVSAADAAPMLAPVFSGMFGGEPVYETDK